MAEATEATEVVRWAVASAEFGATMRNGSCNAVILRNDQEIVCGWPRRADGVCVHGHRPPP